MKAKRVRFKDSENNPDYCASSGFDASSAPCEPREDLTMPPAASNEPKTSEFAFFKRLKQAVGHTSCQNTQNRQSIPVRNCGPTNHIRELDQFKHKDDVKSSQQIKKPTSGEIDSFHSHRNAALESSAMTRKEHDNDGFNCSSPIKTPTSISLDSFLSATANASVNPENLQRDGDIFLSKRLKLRQQIAKTLFPETFEVPKECDLVYVLLSRLLPETSPETLSQGPPQRLRETRESRPLDLDSNILLEDASDTSRKLVKASKDHLLDNRVSASESHRIWGTHPAGQIDEDLDTSVAGGSYRMLLEQTEENEWQSSLNDIASGCWSSRYGGGNLLTWGNELHDYSTTGSIIHNIVENEAYKHSSYDAYDSSQLCTFRNQSHSYELSGSYGSDAAAKRNGSLICEHEIHDFDLDRGPLPTSNCRYDSCSRVSFKSSRPVSKNLRYCTEPNNMSDFEIRREPQPLLLGWNTNELDMHDSTENSHMELEIYHPPSSTYSEYRQRSPEPETYCSPSTWGKNHQDSLENSTMFHYSPYTCQDRDFQGHLIQQNDLVLRSPYAPFRLSYGPEQLNTEDSGLFKDLSKAGSFFLISQKSNYSMENTICERNCPAVEAFPIIKDFESDAGLKCKSLTGILKEQYEYTDNALVHFGRGHSSSLLLTSNENSLATIQPERWSLASVHLPIECDQEYTDNALVHFGRGHSSSPLLTANENSLATIQPERWSLASVHLPIECGQDDSFPLQCHTIEWK